MNIRLALSRPVISVLCAAAVLGAQSVPVAAADCYAIGQRVAAENGGQLAKVSQTDQGCLVVVVVPPKNGQRGRKIEVVVPAD